MSDPIVFDSATPRFRLPLLYAGQSQKEAFVNEALGLTDTLLHCAVQGVLATPPLSPAGGAAWVVGTSATGAWAGQSGKIASLQSGQWLFIEPKDGMRIINLATGQDLRRLGGTWIVPEAPDAPSGGETVDTQARAAISSLLQALKDAGILANA